MEKKIILCILFGIFIVVNSERASVVFTDRGKFNYRVGFCENTLVLNVTISEKICKEKKETFDYWKLLDIVSFTLTLGVIVVVLLEKRKASGGVCCRRKSSGHMRVSPPVVLSSRL